MKWRNFFRGLAHLVVLLIAYRNIKVFLCAALLVTLYDSQADFVFFHAFFDEIGLISTLLGTKCVKCVKCSGTGQKVLQNVWFMLD